MNISGFLVVLAAIFLADVFWVLCIRKVQTSSPLLAGIWSVALLLPSAVGTAAYVMNPWYLIPAGLGAFAGTALATWWEGRNLAR